MSIDDGMLVDLVRQHQYLYDKGHKDHKNKIIKENAWQTIASILSEDSSISPSMCEQRWIVLRNRFCTELRILKTLPSGAVAQQAAWPLFEAMNFLQEFIRTRRTKGSFESPLSSPTFTSPPQSPWSSLNTIIIPEETEEEIQNSEREELHEEPVEKPILKLTIKKKSSAPVQVSEPSPSTSQAASDPDTLQNKRKIGELKCGTIDTPKRRKVEKDPLVEGLSGAMSSFKNYIDNRNDKSKDDDPATNFGIVVGSCIKKMKGRKQTRCMAKIMEIISEYQSDDD